MCDNGNIVMQENIFVRKLVVMFLGVKCYIAVTYLQMIKEKIEKRRTSMWQNVKLTLSGFKCTVEIFQNKKLRKKNKKDFDKVTNYHITFTFEFNLKSFQKYLHICILDNCFQNG